MESKRLGLCQKSIFVVPNHLTEQWASEFLRLYPSANILVTTKKDFETHNRKKFCARIATGDYDAVIIGHSQFERIPISPERQERLLYQQIEEILSLIHIWNWCSAKYVRCPCWGADVLLPLRGRTNSIHRRSGECNTLRFFYVHFSG